MGSELWNEVDQYFARKLLGDDELERVLQANREAGLPEIDVSPLQGKFLTLMAQMKGAKRVLEIGTLGGYSTICLAKGIGVDGRVTTLEVDQAHALIAEGNIRRAGFHEQVEVLVGSALDTLHPDPDPAAGGQGGSVHRHGRLGPDDHRRVPTVGRQPAGLGRRRRHHRRSGASAHPDQHGGGHPDRPDPADPHRRR
ncbi:O-methyltransferase, partial [Rossellomorea marisflavi]|uniref:O-methyltransferase n=1 Tax=Rossellomorea marisflavi TaxID=189381 RepID=UPI003517B385